MKEAHPDPAELAALGEDLLDPAESAAVRGHLADCADCTALLADLELLAVELPLLDPPEPMPTSVADRIEAALAAEADAVSRETQATHTGSAARTPRSAATTATTGGDGRSPGPQISAAGSNSSRRGRRRHYLLAAVGAVVALGAGGLIAQSLGEGGGGPDVVAGASESGAEDDQEMFSEQIDSDALETEVQELLTAPPAGSEETGPQSAPPSSEPPRTDPRSEAPSPDRDDDPAEEYSTQGGVPGNEESAEALGETQQADGTAPECVLAATGRQDQPLAVADHYEYEGVDSYVLILPDRGDEESVDVFVVDAACAIDQPTEAGVVLHADTYPRA
ncbi:hypothetical protein [Streptomyces lonarensis]|uniref:Zinc-finger domain-containing protein n=1 Tax=Streptomyces lonarensis TaxID=700599 RepID=A0A7X6HZA2_9ACTN|nr:hypothetical protein [Streptomyces lonarensis]NJQ06448.1 hypothetical protein [Streptomyces lonarensis]